MTEQELVAEEKEITRYDLTNGPYPYITSIGNWVKYSDYEAEIAALKAKNENIERERDDSRFVVTEFEKEINRLTADLAEAREALRIISEYEDSDLCQRCEGNGRVYADGKAHFPSEMAATILCPVCGGEGRILNQSRCAEIAAAVLAKQKGEKT